MNSSGNFIFNFFLLTCLDSIMSVYGKTKCEINILSDFEFAEKFPENIRTDMPRKAFLRKTINELTNDDAKSYFEHLHLLLQSKDTMLLPRDYCENITKSSILSGTNDYLECVDQLCEIFLDSRDKTEILKDTFLNFTEKMFSKLDPRDYRYKYFYHMCRKIIYPHSVDQRFPLTIREFCFDRYPDNFIDLMTRDKSELTKEEALQYCATKIFNDFELTVTWKQYKSRSIMPKTAFLRYVEDDLESPDATDYYYHIYSVIKAKDGSENPRQYCNKITANIEEDKRIEEEKKCVGYLLSMYLDSDATTVLRDAFRNFKESHFAKTDEKDYRVRYFYYLSGCFDFNKIQKFKDTPLTPKEYCKIDRTEALNLRIITESETINEGGTSSLTSRQT